MALAAAILWYGDGEHPTWHHLRHHADVNRQALGAAAALMATNLALFVYVQVRARQRGQRWQDYPELQEPWVMQAAAPCGGMAVIMLLWACWGIYGWLTPVVVYLFLMALVFSSSFVPNVLGLRLKRKAA